MTWLLGNYILETWREYDGELKIGGLNMQNKLEIWELTADVSRSGT